jgi:hypothetical protein
LKRALLFCLFGVAVALAIVAPGCGLWTALSCSPGEVVFTCAAVEYLQTADCACGTKSPARAVVFPPLCAVDADDAAQRALADAPKSGDGVDEEGFTNDAYSTPECTMGATPPTPKRARLPPSTTPTYTALGYGGASACVCGEGGAGGDTGAGGDGSGAGTGAGGDDSSAAATTGAGASSSSDATAAAAATVGAGGDGCGERHLPRGLGGARSAGGAP